MPDPAPSISSEPIAAQPIGSITILIYGLDPGESQVQVSWPPGTQSGESNLVAARSALCKTMQGELARAFRGFGAT